MVDSVYTLSWNDETLKRRCLGHHWILHPLFARPCVDVCCGPWSNGRFVNLYFAPHDHWFDMVPVASAMATRFRSVLPLGSTYCNVSQRGRERKEAIFPLRDTISTRWKRDFRDFIFFLSFFQVGIFNREWIIFRNLDVEICESVGSARSRRDKSCERRFPGDKTN